MAYTRVPEVAAGQMWSAADFNTYYRDNLNAIYALAKNPALKLITQLIATEDEPEATFGDIPQTFKHLLIQLRGRIRVSTQTGGGIAVRFNGDMNPDYYSETLTCTGSGGLPGISEALNSTLVSISTNPSDNAPNNYSGSSQTIIYDYTSTKWAKFGNSEWAFKEHAGGMYLRRRAFMWTRGVLGEEAINRITLMIVGYTDFCFLKGTIISLYGYN